jgi:hypothetical protein
MSKIFDELEADFENMLEENEIGDEAFISSGYGANECIIDWCIKHINLAKQKADKLADEIHNYLNKLDQIHKSNHIFSISESNSYTSPLRKTLKEYREDT